MTLRHLTRSAFPLVLVLAAAACGSTSKTIDTKTALAFFRHAGFTSLAVFPAGKADWIYTRGYHPVEMPLSAARLATVGAAEQRYANDQPLLLGKLSADERSAVPTGFKADSLRDVRVCNVVVSSYNPNRARSVTQRFDRAVALLRAKC
jgi:hypothetical protein